MSTCQYCKCSYFEGAIGNDDEDVCLCYEKFYEVSFKDGVLYLSGGVTISYGIYVIRSDLLMAKTNGVDSHKIKIIEANKNVYFSNNKNISAKSDKLFMDVDKKIVTLEGDVEFSQDKSIIRAKKINVDLKTETVDFEGIQDSFIKN